MEESMNSNQHGQASQAVLDNIKQAVEEKYPHAQIELTALPGVISAVVFTQDKRTLESVYAQRDINNLAHRSGGLSSEFYTSMVFYSDRKDLARRKVFSFIEPKLQDISKNYHVDVEVGINGKTLSVRVIGSRDYMGAFKAKVRDMSPEMLRLSECRQVNTYFSTGYELESGERYQAADEDNDDDPINPNWPSTTGNPSGGGRGNNPPR